MIEYEKKTETKLFGCQSNMLGSKPLFYYFLNIPLTLSYLGIRPLLFFLHYPKTAQGIKLKLSDFKDTPLRHILQVKPVSYILSCCHGNKITKGTSQNLARKKSEKSAICKDIELKFGMETKFGPLSSKTNKFTI